jgi:ligand-binding sensor domain-containing protein/serine phosphatase RsbU (regulator of sigma subunit)
MHGARFKTWGILILLLSLNNLSAQFNNFKKWSVKEGLIQSDIYDILQDSRGYLWIASGGGVSKFDGVKFTHFTKFQGLSGNVVRSLFEDSRGRLWFGTNEGLDYYDGLKFRKIKDKNYKGSTALCFGEDKYQNLYVGTDDGGLNIMKFEGDSAVVQNMDDSNGLSSNSVMDLAIDGQQQIWLATYGGGLNVLRNNTGKPKCAVFKGGTKLPSDQLLTVAINGDDVWLGSYDAGAFRFSREKILQNDFSSPLLYNTANGLNSNYIWDILISSDDKIWLASVDNGINRLQKAREGYSNTSFTSKNGLSDDQVLSLFEDKEKNIWIGTNGNGLNMLVGDYFSHFNSHDGLPSDKIQAIQQDNENNYWLASSGTGLSRLNFKNNFPIVTNFSDKEGRTKFVSSIAVGNVNNKNIWLGTDKEGTVKFDGTRFFNFTEKNGLINDRVYSLYVDSKGIVWIGTADGISRFDGLKFLNISTDKMQMQNEGVNTITEDNKNYIWFGTSGGLARYKGEGDLRTFDEVEGLKAKDVSAITSHHNGDIYIGTNTGGIYKYNHLKNDTGAIEFVANDSLLLSNSIRSLKFVNDSTLIAGTFKGFNKINFDQGLRIKSVKHYTAKNGFNGLECNDNAILLDHDKNIWFGTINGLTKYSPALDYKAALIPMVHITDVQLAYKDVNWSTKNTEKQKWFNIPEQLELAYDDNQLTFKFQAINYNNPEALLYKYKLVGNDKEWSPPRNSNTETFSGIEPGIYTFMVMAQSDGGPWSEAATLKFTIRPPWYRTTVFYITLFILIVSLIYGYIKWREQNLIKEKIVLEGIVKERTQEVTAQKHLIEEKHKEITDSINYAERIQRSFLASTDLLTNHLKEYFVLFQPKDVVSGDFYWAAEIPGPEGGTNFILATADSTGHGVPGAIMSLLNITSLEKAIEYSNDPAEILNDTRQTIIKRLKKDGSAEGGKDGMDCSLIIFDFLNKKIDVAAANNPVWIVRKHTNDGSDTELIEIKPDKMPVGKHDRDNESFKTQKVDLKDGDVVYTLTDGFPDQFGGDKGKKFMSKNLKELLFRNAQLPMFQQKEILQEVFIKWVGNAEQVDDVTVIGVRI